MRWRGHIRSSQSALHSRNTFGTITLHPRFPLFSSSHSIFFRFILFIFIPTIYGSIYGGPSRRQRRHRVVVLVVPFRCVWFCARRTSTHPASPSGKYILLYRMCPLRPMCNSNKYRTNGPEAVSRTATVSFYAIPNGTYMYISRGMISWTFQTDLWEK